jgi:hypothetical protein
MRLIVVVAVQNCTLFKTGHWVQTGQHPDVDMSGAMDVVKPAAAVRDRWPPIHIVITAGKARPLTVPAKALFIPKPYIGRNVVAAMQTFDRLS